MSLTGERPPHPARRVRFGVKQFVLVSEILRDVMLKIAPSPNLIISAHYR